MTQTAADHIELSSIEEADGRNRGPRSGYLDALKSLLQAFDAVTA